VKKSYAKQRWYAKKIKNVCGVNDTAYTIFVFENRSYLGEFDAEFKKALAHVSGAQEVLFDEKKPRVENLVTLSL
jgi:hypothetical protein